MSWDDPHTVAYVADLWGAIANHRQAIANAKNVEQWHACVAHMEDYDRDREEQFRLSFLADYEKNLAGLLDLVGDDAMLNQRATIHRTMRQASANHKGQDHRVLSDVGAALGKLEVTAVDRESGTVTMKLRGEP